MNQIRTHNVKFAQVDDPFRKACDKAGVKPTHRQASKWRRKIGLAWRYGRKLQKAVE